MILSPIVIFLSVMSTTFQYGFFSFGGITILICLICLLYLIFLRFDNLKRYLSVPDIIWPYVFISCYALFLFFNGGIYQTNFLPSILIIFFSIVSLPVVLSYIVPAEKIPGKQRRYRYLFLILLAVILRIGIITASPDPKIDVYYLLKQAPEKLIQGINPYASNYTQVYRGVKPDYNNYGPVSVYIQIPFLIVHDPRVLLFVADIACALLLFFMGGKTLVAEAISLIYLFRPNSLFILEQSYLAPLEVFFFLMAFALFRAGLRIPGLKKELLSAVAVAFLTGIKVHYVLLPFLILPVVKNKLKYILTSVSVILLIYVPFIVWNPGAFKYQFIDFFFRTDSSMPNVPVHRSMNFSSLLYVFTGNSLPLPLLLLTDLILGGVILYYLYSRSLRKQNSSLLSLCLLGAVLFYMILYFFGHYAFINYYFMLTGALLLWILSLSW